MFAIVIAAVPTAQPPTTPTAPPATDEFIRAIDRLTHAVEQQQSQGLPIGLQMLLSLAVTLLAGLIAWGIARGNRRHDREQRLTEARRDALNSARSVVGTVRKVLIDMQMSIAPRYGSRTGRLPGTDELARMQEADASRVALVEALRAQAFNLSGLFASDTEVVRELEEVRNTVLSAVTVALTPETYDSLPEALRAYDGVRDAAMASVSAFSAAASAHTLGKPLASGA